MTNKSMSPIRYKTQFHHIMPIPSMVPWTISRSNKHNYLVNWRISTCQHLGSQTQPNVLPQYCKTHVAILLYEQYLTNNRRSTPSNLTTGCPKVTPDSMVNVHTEGRDQRALLTDLSNKLLRTYNTPLRGIVTQINIHNLEYKLRSTLSFDHIGPLMIP